mmetsp:Transcript_37879/g.67705  ORF Transcript_37879/g.67705 Transcript_37879/m.67705 type:complete len:246 (-) Transcript_37879:91-828(-)
MCSCSCLASVGPSMTDLVTNPTRPATLPTRPKVSSCSLRGSAIIGSRLSRMRSYTSHLETSPRISPLESRGSSFLSWRWRWRMNTLPRRKTPRRSVHIPARAALSRTSRRPANFTASLTTDAASVAATSTASAESPKPCAALSTPIWTRRRTPKNAAVSSNSRGRSSRRASPVAVTMTRTAAAPAMPATASPTTMAAASYTSSTATASTTAPPASWATPNRACRDSVSVRRSFRSGSSGRSWGGS